MPASKSDADSDSESSRSSSASSASSRSSSSGTSSHSSSQKQGGTKSSGSSRSSSASHSSSSSSSHSDQSGKAKSAKGALDRIRRKKSKGTVGLKANKYLKRIEEDPSSIERWLQLATYLLGPAGSSVRDADRAERYFKRAIRINPKHPGAYTAYAIFLETIRHDNDHAEEMYKRGCDLATELVSNDAAPYCYYAVFLKKEKKNILLSEEYYKKALVANPLHVNSLGNYGLLLWKDKSLQDVHILENADTYLQRAAKLATQRKHAHWPKLYAQFLAQLHSSTTKATNSNSNSNNGADSTTASKEAKKWYKKGKALRAGGK